MASNKFLTSLIQEEISLSKNSNRYSKFDNFLKKILNEEDALNPAEPETQADAATTPPVAGTPEGDTSVLPGKDALARIQLVQLAAACFLTDVDSIRREKSKEDVINRCLTELDKIDEQLGNPETAAKAIQLLLTAVRIKDGGQYANLKVNIDDVIHKMNAATRILMIGVCIQSLSTPMDKVQTADPFIDSTLETLPDNLDTMEQLSQDPSQLEAALKAADDTYNNIKKILATNSTGSMMVTSGD